MFTIQIIVDVTAQIDKKQANGVKGTFAPVSEPIIDQIDKADSKPTNDITREMMVDPLNDELK